MGRIVVFPARAGMSPYLAASMRPSASVPRASGDEPAKNSPVTVQVGCSPRERG